jgi:DNA-binding transcriptional regulator YiaG
MSNKDPLRYGRRGRRPAREWTAESIAALRARLGLSQAAMADELGVRQQTVSEWETGRYEPRGASARVLSMLADATEPYAPGPGVRPERSDETDADGPGADRGGPA